jgi:hypothetical protein
VSEPLAITLSPEAVDQLVERVAELVLERLQEQSGASPWLTRAEAATYLRVPASRLEKDRRIPCHRWDGRVFYNRHELDEWLSIKLDTPIHSV